MNKLNNEFIRSVFWGIIFSFFIWMSITSIIKCNAYATAYYVDSVSGSDSNTGLSDAQAWETTQKVNDTSFSPGDDVYFKCDGVWASDAGGSGENDESLSIDWSGTDSNQAVIGAYYGSETIVTDTLTCAAQGKTNPKFTGSWSVPYPASKWTALISSADQDYVTIQDVIIENSNGRGIAVNSAVYPFDGIIIQRTKVDGAGQAGIICSRCANGNIDENEITDTGRKFLMDIYDGGTSGCNTACFQADPAGSCATCSDWPASISTKPYSTDMTVSRNTIYRNFGEGIGIYDHCEDIIVEDNHLYANRAGHIYLERARRIIVRNNLAYSIVEQNSTTYGRDEVYYRWSGDIDNWDWSFCYGQNDEDQYNESWSQDNEFYGNLCASSGAGIALWASDALAKTTGTLVYNNTIVDCTRGIVYEDKVTDTGNEIYNNIVTCVDRAYDSSPDSSSDCSMDGGVLFSGDTLIDYNQWHTDPGGDFTGSNDVVDTDPELEGPDGKGWDELDSDDGTGDLDASAFQTDSPTAPWLAVGYSGLGDAYDPIVAESTNFNSLPPVVVTGNQSDYGDHDMGGILYGVSPNTGEFVGIFSGGVFQ